jgi:phosphoglucomutase
VGTHTFGGFTVEVIDPIADYLTVLKEVFDFEALKAFVSREDFSMVFDAMNAVTGPYAKAIFVEELGAHPFCIQNATPLPDFGGGHPDPNLTYAHELVGVWVGVGGWGWAVCVLGGVEEEGLGHGTAHAQLHTLAGG